MQRRAHALQDRERGWFTRFLVECCGRRGGKTQSGAGQFSSNMLADLDNKLLGREQWAGQPHAPWVRSEGKDPEAFLRYFVVAPTNALLDEPKIALRKYLGHVKDEEPGLIENQGRDENGIYCWWLVGGIRIDFFSGERPELLVGRGYDGGWFEEAARLKPSVWRDNIRPALSDKRGWAIFTTTPLGRNWFWREIWARGDAKAAALVARLEGGTAADYIDAEFACISWTTADNDAIPELAAEMEVARRQMPAALFRRNYLADFDAFEGQCFDLSARNARKWNRGERFRRVFAGFDSGNVGKTSHRSAFVIVVEGLDEVWHEAATESANDILPFGDDAWRERDRGDRSTWANRLYIALRTLMGDMWRAAPVFVPADRADIKREWERYGFNVMPAFQEHEAGLTWVQVALANGRLTVASECLWNCMSALHFPEAGKASRKLWVDENDDEWDALRYALSEVVRDGETPALAPLAAMGWRSR